MPFFSCASGFCAAVVMAAGNPPGKDAPSAGPDLTLATATAVGACIPYLLIVLKMAYEGNSAKHPVVYYPSLSPQVVFVAGASDAGMRLYADLLDVLELEGVTTVREDTEPSNGYFDPLRRHVAIGRHIDGDQATKTLTHETAHVVAGHTLGMNSRDVETVAESAAFVVLNHYGIDSSGYTFPYVASWAQDRAILKRNLGAVQATAHQVIVDLEGESE